MEGKRRAEVGVGARREGEAGVVIAKGVGARTRVVNEKEAGVGTGDAVAVVRGNVAVPGAGNVEGASELHCMYPFLRLGL